MCGITGIFTKSSSIDLRKEVINMTHALEHRGPDGQGIHVESLLNFAMGHTRLSIQDLSVSGLQPMKNNRYIIVFNGEIYNFKKLRQELINLGETFFSGTDTEVLLCLINKIGLKKSLNKIIGMFAFSLLDLKKKKLFIVSDRMSEKPVYYGWNGNAFLFASELKAMESFSGWLPVLDRNSVDLFFTYNYIPYPKSIYKGIKKLSPGMVASLDLVNNQLSYYKYWDLPKINKNPKKDITSNIEFLLNDAVRRCMVSDAPLGSFLSGGIDSSLISAIAQKQSNKKLNTFTVSFDNPEFDESIYAKKVAEHIGSNHTEVFISNNDLLSLIPNMARIYDEPFSDTSQIPTYLLCKSVPNNIKVLLSGDGADEIFGGYRRHKYAEIIGKLSNVFPKYVLNVLSKIMLFLSKINEKSFLGKILNYLDGQYKYRFDKLSEILSTDTSLDLYNRIVRHWNTTDNLFIKDFLIDSDNGKQIKPDVKDSVLDQILNKDRKLYLPGNALTKIDRASMHNQIECRAPFLDVDLIEFALPLPGAQHLLRGVPKYHLKKVLYKHVPQNLIDRPKMGFGVPIGEWLRGPLKSWSENLIDKKTIIDQGIFNYKTIKACWEKTQNGDGMAQYKMWDILIFQSWLKGKENKIQI